MVWTGAAETEASERDGEEMMGVLKRREALVLTRVRGVRNDMIVDLLTDRVKSGDQSLATNAFFQIKTSEV